MLFHCLQKYYCKIHYIPVHVSQIKLVHIKDLTPLYKKKKIKFINYKQNIKETQRNRGIYYLGTMTKACFFTLLYHRHPVLPTICSCLHSLLSVLLHSETTPLLNTGIQRVANKIQEFTRSLCA